MVGSIKVQPTPPHGQLRRPTATSQVSEAYHKVTTYWHQFQIGHRERYSVERMLALRDYCEHTSLLRVISVCLLAPLPAFTAAVLIECIPLASPSDGWRANYAFWTRLFLSSFPMAIGGVLQVKQVIPSGTISIKATIGIGSGTATGYVVCAMALAALWEFPIPFGYVVMVGPFVLSFMGSFGLAIGLFSMKSALRQQILPQLSVLAAQGLLAGCYPPFFAIFRQLSGLQQTASVFVLPFIKMLNKQYIARQCAHFQEYVGPMVIFSVDVCNVLYTVICLQTAVSSITTMFMISSDVFFIAIALYSLQRSDHKNYLQTLPVLVRQVYQNVESFNAPFACVHRSHYRCQWTVKCSCRNCVANPRMLFQVVQAAESCIQSSLPDIRYLSRHTEDDADWTPAFVTGAWQFQASPIERTSIMKKVVVPMLRAPKIKVARRSLSVIAMTTERLLSPLVSLHLHPKSAVQEVQDALQVMFHSEYILLSEYVECVLPVLYATYLAVLHHLPTAAYYPHMRSLTSEKLNVILQNMMLYGLVEFASFIGVTILLKRRFGFSPLYQVAFVLETQAQTLQSLLFVWVLCILQFTLVHNGSKVHPVAVEKPRLLAVAMDTFDRAFQAAGNYWNHLQVGHRGRYSVQRLLSLRDYCERTSPMRVFLVCTMSLVPSFIMAILVECIPLKHPDEGWKANYAFWIRLYVSSLPTAFGAVFQVKETIEPGVISKAGILVTGIGSCTCYVALTMLIAVLWKFPIPFGYVLTVAPFVFFYMVFFLLSIGPRVLRKSPALRHKLFSQMTVITAQGVLAIAYPTFSAIFNQLSATQQSIFIFVLPLIKFSVKQVIAKASAHLKECVGLIVVFSVDVCNVLYVVVCMQTAISPVTTTVMIASDAFFVLLALRSIYYQLNATQGRLQSLNSSKGNYLEDLLVLIRGIFRENDNSNGAPVSIRVSAPLPLPISIESARYLNEIVHTKRRNARDATLPTIYP
ncbi:hypothetical protein GQ600_17297 [Phytophthora cactorum]|nr:hypothetical protein GQ600_17297 [Phytophthora cactorum]